MAKYEPNSMNGSHSKNKSLSNIDISQIITGCKDQGAKQYQEDSLCTFYSPDLTFLVAGVFDGHGGLNGQVASQIVSKLCLEYFSQNWQKAKTWNNQQWTQQMEIFYDNLHQKVRDEFIQVIIIILLLLCMFIKLIIHYFNYFQLISINFLLKYIFSWKLVVENIVNYQPPMLRIKALYENHQDSRFMVVLHVPLYA